MAASIFGTRFLARGKPAWWDIEGTYTFKPEDKMTVSQLFEKAGLNYEVELWNCAAVGSKPGQVIRLDDKKIIVRRETPDDPYNRVFGVAGTGYSIIQNKDLAKLLDPICDFWPVATGGALGNGDRVFMTLDAGSVSVGDKTGKGDEFRKYFSICDNKGYGTGLKAIFTPVRIECANTWASAMKAATTTITIPHNLKVAETAKWRIELMAKLERAQRESLAMFDRMTEVKLDENQTTAVVEAAYPLLRPGNKTNLAYELDGDESAELVPVMVELSATRKNFEYQNGRQREFRAGAMELLGKFNSDFPHFADTAYAVCNAVIECSDWRNSTNTASVGESTLFGNRAAEKNRAIQQAWAFCSN